MVDIVEIYVHWYAGRSKSQVSASLGVDRKTIRKYLAPAEAAGITPGGPPMSETDWAKLLKSWFPELASRKLNQVRWAEIEPHRDYVKELLKTTTVATIWASHEAARADVFRFIEVEYNRTRLRKHPVYGYVTPVETRALTAQDLAPAA
ncbi:hypothetical protein ACFY0A_43125 [Streptomyces sp. NPDC001698]|uniref:hypothetical protein n=1 Tax=unclassified Streptomyces TaxID=2593676 RepID=UPI0036985865